MEKMPTRIQKRRYVYAPDQLWILVEDLTEQTQNSPSEIMRALLKYLKDEVDKRELLARIKNE